MTSTNTIDMVAAEHKPTVSHRVSKRFVPTDLSGQPIPQSKPCDENFGPLEILDGIHQTNKNFQKMMQEAKSRVDRDDERARKMVLEKLEELKAWKRQSPDEKMSETNSTRYCQA